MSIHRLLLVSACVALLAGCGATPSRVRLPDVVPTASGDQRYVVAYTRDAEGKDTVAQTLADARSQRLPLEVSREGVLAQLAAHEHVWFQAGVDLAHRKEDMGNLQFGGAALGAVGVIAKSLDVGRAGAALAGATGVWDGRYQLEVQRNNYRQASQAVRCARLKVEAIQPAFFTAYYYGGGGTGDKAGMLRFSKELLTSRGMDDAGFDRLMTLYPTINGRLQDMRDALQKAQESVTLATPSSSDILSALQQKTQENEDNKRQAASTTQNMKATAQDLYRSQWNIQGLAQGDIGKLQPKDFQALVDRVLATRIQRRQATLDDLPLDDTVAQAAAASVNSGTLKQALDLHSELDTCVALMSNK